MKTLKDISFVEFRDIIEEAFTTNREYNYSSRYLFLGVKAIQRDKAEGLNQYGYEIRFLGENTNSLIRYLHWGFEVDKVAEKFHQDMEHFSPAPKWNKIEDIKIE